MAAVVQGQPHRALDAEDLGHADAEDEPAHRISWQMPGDHHAHRGGGRDQHHGRDVAQREDVVDRGGQDRGRQQGDHQAAEHERGRRRREATAPSVLARSHHRPLLIWRVDVSQPRTRAIRDRYVVRSAETTAVRPKLLLAVL